MNSFSISKRESVKENINRILSDQVGYILEHCRGEQKDIHYSIHEIRKSIKRIRALLRLIREEIGYSTYYRENIFFRDINRSISDLRTYNVLNITLKKFQTDLSNTIPGETFEPLIKSIIEQRDLLLSGMLSKDSALNNLPEKILEAGDRIRKLPVEQNGFEVFEGGLQRTYRQGRKYFSIAYENPGMHPLHDMRKRIKYLWYQMEILKPVHPGIMRAIFNSLGKISEGLGVYHDLDVLTEYLQNNDTQLEPRVVETLIDASELKKTTLLPRIWKQAGPIYSEKPGAFVGRMNEYWRYYRYPKI